MATAQAQLPTALFVYKRKITDSSTGEESFNDNFLNLFNVMSAYWATNENGQRILNVYLMNGYSITFGESMGTKFLEHWENLLRANLGMQALRAAAPAQSRKTSRMPIEVVEDADSSSGDNPQWV